jgi:hypothetical protein
VLKRCGESGSVCGKLPTPILPLPSEAEEGTEDRLEVKGQEVKPKLPNRAVEKARWGCHRAVVLPSSWAWAEAYFFRRAVMVMNVVH